MNKNVYQEPKWLLNEHSCNNYIGRSCLGWDVKQWETNMICAELPKVVKAKAVTGNYVKLCTCRFCFNAIKTESGDLNFPNKLVYSIP